MVLNVVSAFVPMEATTYSQRLAAAIGVDEDMGRWGDADRDRVKRFASALGITRQAVEKYFRDGSKALSSPNNSRAARYLRVDPDWLATGEGVMRGARAWPFGDELSPEDFFALSDEEVRPAVDVLRAAAARRHQARALTPSEKRAANAR